MLSKLHDYFFSITTRVKNRFYPTLIRDAEQKAMIEQFSKLMIQNMLSEEPAPLPETLIALLEQLDGKPLAMKTDLKNGSCTVFSFNKKQVSLESCATSSKDYTDSSCQVRAA